MFTQQWRDSDITWFKESNNEKQTGGRPEDCRNEDVEPVEVLLRSDTIRQNKE